jgi:putative CocE/NonD family hydrolase
MARLAVSGMLVGVALGATPSPAQDPAARRTAALAYIAEHAEREEMVMIPMRDGVRLSALILFPKGQPRKNLPTILVYNPYLTESMLGAYAPYVESAIRSGYAFMIENVRGRYWSEGTYTFLTHAGVDGYDSIDWISKEPWSNGKVGMMGCSSGGEEQHKINAMHHPALAATVPMSSGAGIGRIGPYNEQGGFYRGGAFQTGSYWFWWYHLTGWANFPKFSRDLTREQLIRLSRFWTLDPNTVPASGIDTLIWTVPLNRVITKMGAPPNDLEQFVNWLPNDHRWDQVNFGREGDQYGAPMLMLNAWYDASIGPNVAMYQHQASHAVESARPNMFMVVGPTVHCGMLSETEHTVVGEHEVGDARFDYVGLVQKWFDHFLKGADNGVTREPKVRAYMMGANQWRSYDRWPPAEARGVTYYLESDGRANSLLGNGRLTTTPPRRLGQDAFVYDWQHPVPSLGGSMCCGSASWQRIFQGGSFDQSAIELREDVLVYSTPPLTERVEITGPVKVSLYLSSDAKDTDLTVKLVDVYPDGRAFNLDESIQRVRWREGWDRPVFMEPGTIYKVDVGPLATSNAFLPGHRIRIEVSSSDFPHFERNLNTGGNNFDEEKGVVAHNVIHHGPKYPSSLILPVLRVTP